MPDNLQDLFEKDQEALAFFDSLPMFAQDQVLERGARIGTAEELSGVANEIMRRALQLEPYQPMFEDETDSKIDLM